MGGINRFSISHITCSVKIQVAHNFLDQFIFFKLLDWRRRNYVMYVSSMSDMDTHKRDVKSFYCAPTL